MPYKVSEDDGTVLWHSQATGFRTHDRDQPINTSTAAANVNVVRVRFPAYLSSYDGS